MAKNPLRSGFNQLPRPPSLICVDLISFMNRTGSNKLKEDVIESCPGPAETWSHTSWWPRSWFRYHGRWPWTEAPGSVARARIRERPHPDTETVLGKPGGDACGDITCCQAMLRTRGIHKGVSGDNESQSSPFIEDLLVCLTLFEVFRGISSFPAHDSPRRSCYYLLYS